MLISLLCLVFGDIVPFFWKSWRNKKKNNTRKMFTLLQWVLQYVIIFTCSYAKPCRNKQFCLHLSMFNFLYSILQVWRLLQTWPGGNAFVSIQFTVQFIFIFVCHWDKNKIYFVFNKKKRKKTRRNCTLKSNYFFRIYRLTSIYMNQEILRSKFFKVM